MEDKKENNLSDLPKRYKSAAIILSILAGVVISGPIYIGIAIIILTYLIFRELINLENYLEKNKKLKNYFFINYYFFTVFTYYFHVLSFFNNVNKDEMYFIFMLLNKYHSAICFLAYLIGIIIFLYSLTKSNNKYCFKYLGFIHIIALLVIFPASLIVRNIFNGIYWFVIPALLVAINEYGSLYVGRKLGKTKISDLSPKKTLEGFIGGFIATIIVGFVVLFLLSYQNLFII